MSAHLQPNLPLLSMPRMSPVPPHPGVAALRHVSIGAVQNARSTSVTPPSTRIGSMLASLVASQSIGCFALAIANIRPVLSVLSGRGYMATGKG